MGALHLMKDIKGGGGFKYFLLLLIGLLFLQIEPFIL